MHTNLILYISFTTRMAHPLFKLKRSILLVMYRWLNSFYCEMNNNVVHYLGHTHQLY